MKTSPSKFITHLLIACLALGVSLTARAADTAKKKLLVVTVTKGFRHSSIPTAEKIIQKLADETGVFTVEYVRNDEDMAAKMTAANLKQYDGFIFANTTGILPLPDKDAFLNQIKEGKAFIGMHSASDTFHGKGMIDPYIDMCGGEFKGHGAQVGVEMINKDPKHPATKHLGPTWKVAKEEIYLFQNYDPAKLRDLLILDKHPNKPEEAGHFPVAWCKMYGKGRVFYTSLGHREDVWDEETPAAMKRENGKEVSKAFQDHILGGIKWALGLLPGESKPLAQ